MLRHILSGKIVEGSRALDELYLHNSDNPRVMSAKGRSAVIDMDDAETLFDLWKKIPRVILQ